MRDPISQTKYDERRKVKAALRKIVAEEVKVLKVEKRGCPRFSSQWHRTDSAIQALLWVKQTVLR